MARPINHDPYESVPKLLGSMPNTSEEIGRTRKIVSMRFVESETITRCVSVGCDKNDCPMKKHVTYKFPWDIKRVTLKLDGGARVKSRYVTTPRYERQ
jgi:hypothetical protein